MHRFVGTLVLAQIICLSAIGAFAQGSDDAIAARVETLHVMEPHLSAFNIVTTSSNGFVVLTGAVRDEIQKELAQELAASVEGVRDVVNEIQVVEDAANFGPERSWRQKVVDRSVRASVRTRLFYHKQFKGLAIAAQVENNVATLTGVVPTEELKRRIGEIAYDTRGVDLVMNEILVRPRQTVTGARKVSRAFSDEWVEKRVETSILMTRNLSIRKVNVEVQDGLCILTGIVDSHDQKSRAGNVAADVQGVDSVENAILVRAHSRSSVTPDDSEPATLTDLEPLSPRGTQPDSLPTVSSSPLPPK